MGLCEANKLKDYIPMIYISRMNNLFFVLKQEVETLLIGERYLYLF